jgi:hypothetical protein
MVHRRKVLLSLPDQFKYPLKPTLQETCVNGIILPKLIKNVKKGHGTPRPQVSSESFPRIKPLFKRSKVEFIAP